MVFADELEIHLWPKGSCAWMPQDTQVAVMTPGQNQKAETLTRPGGRCRRPCAPQRPLAVQVVRALLYASRHRSDREDRCTATGKSRRVSVPISYGCLLVPSCVCSHFTIKDHISQLLYCGEISKRAKVELRGCLKTCQASEASHHEVDHRHLDHRHLDRSLTIEG